MVDFGRTAGFLHLDNLERPENRCSGKICQELHTSGCVAQVEESDAQNHPWPKKIQHPLFACTVIFICRTQFQDMSKADFRVLFAVKTRFQGCPQYIYSQLGSNSNSPHTRDTGVCPPSKDTTDAEGGCSFPINLNGYGARNSEPHGCC